MVAPGLHPNEGSGPRGMRERIESLGGKMRVESAGSTRLTIQIPHRQEPV
jgi:signal transduction histidine kinase